MLDGSCSLPKWSKVPKPPNPVRGSGNCQRFYSFSSSRLKITNCSLWMQTGDIVYSHCHKQWKVAESVQRPPTAHGAAGSNVCTGRHAPVPVHREALIIHCSDARDVLKHASSLLRISVFSSIKTSRGHMELWGGWREYRQIDMEGQWQVFAVLSRWRGNQDCCEYVAESAWTMV